ncbi:MAG: hypothetical protein OQL20_09330 [Sedimenticola sp.]|nr:hypothetical protein [Sedimenticola sp.]
MPHDTGLDRQGLITQIRQHCKNRDTGTLFLLTEKRATVKLVIAEGTIAALSYQSIRGEEAILPMSRLLQCSMRYYPGVKLLPANQTLPTTEQIINRLQGGATNEDAVQGNTQILIEKPNRSNLSETVQDALEDVLTILIDETTEFMGPFATVLCRKYMEGAGNPPTLSEIQRALHQLAEDIRDKTKSNQLEQNVLQRIRL